ncbi:ATP-grasp domain-containing protein [Mangrovihabitans endophyticus]|uniref:Argininosuccinate lyase n=1 Tax=Mangrovihabitans endophyticus TaxID=1751298 RepID=A0A8J3BW24_9ACTN|nr:ATP-grasp domain-containing protein [Mangrovihabitans endophyticus]GGK73934.1 argininosuccinate lyase [Mangrovihabitans endophyticus]
MSTSEKTVLIVGGTDDTVRKAHALGLRVLLLQHPTKISDRQRELADQVHVLDYTDWTLVEPVVRELHAAPGFRVAVSLTEPGLENAARANELFGIEATPVEVVRRMRDKTLMREWLAGRDRRAVAAAPLRAESDLAAFGAAHGYPYVVKPADGTASLAVFLVEGAGQEAAVWDAVCGLRGTRTDRVSTLFVLQDFVMEEYIDGPEFSVESMSFGGRHVIVTITEKFLGAGTFAEIGHGVPARLDPAVRQEIREAVSEFLTHMGYRDGVAHTELRFGPRGPAIIETHNRISGDAVPELVERVYGVDLSTYALAWPFGLVEPLPDEPGADGAAASRFVLGRPGTVVSVEGAEQAAAEDDVFVVRISAKPGDTVRQLTDNWDRLGLVAVAGPDTSAALLRSEKLINDRIRITVSHADGTTSMARAAELGTPAAEILAARRAPGEAR